MELGVLGYPDPMKVDRTIAKKSTLRDHVDDDYVEASIEERLLMVWPLTREVASLSPRHDVERRLQRDVAVLGRRGS